MFCSTIIPTINRSTLSRAVSSVLDQDFEIADFQVIVVNDSGYPLPDAHWKRSKRVLVVNTNQRERCVARNTGAAIARGRYLHFLDEDDWLIPGALKKLWELSRSTNSAWLYGASQLVDRDGNFFGQLRPQISGNCFIQVMAGEWVPPGSSLIKTDCFFEVGGYNPHILFSEDVDLCRRIALRWDIVGTKDIIACLEMGAKGSSSDYVQAHKIYRWARENILNNKHTFKRMRVSATSSYWYGRLVRVYLTSAIWNLQRKKLLMAASRFLMAMLGVIVSGSYVFSLNYWQTLIKSHKSDAYSL